MANMEERLEAVVARAEVDGAKWHDIVHGDDNTTIATENGNVPTVSKQLKDIRNAITGGLADVVKQAEAARDEAVVAKNATTQLKNDTNSLKSDTEQLKSDTLAIKNQAVEVFNNISTATDTAIANIKTEADSQSSNLKNIGASQAASVKSAGATQISNVKTEGQKHWLKRKQIKPNITQRRALRRRSGPGCRFPPTKKCRTDTNRFGIKTP